MQASIIVVIVIVIVIVSFTHVATYDMHVRVRHEVRAYRLLRHRANIKHNSNE